MQSIREILLVSLISFSVASSIGNGFDESDSPHKKNYLRYQPVVDGVVWDVELYNNLYGNETTVSPTVAPSSNATTISPSPAPSVAPTTAEPTTAEPTTAEPTTAPPSTKPPTSAPPTPSPSHHRDREWWINIFKFLIKTVFWIFVAVLFFFAFGGIMSNRYRIYYYLRGSWYSLLRKLKWPWRSGRDGSAPSSTLNDIIFSDNDLQEGLLMRET